MSCRRQVVGLHLSNIFNRHEVMAIALEILTDCTSFFRKVTSDKETFLVMDVSSLLCSVFYKNENVCVWEMQRRKAQRR